MKHYTLHDLPLLATRIGQEDWPKTASSRKRLVATIRRAYLLEKALVRIAAFHDESASEYLAETGSHSAFAEPGSVRLAREALANKTRRYVKTTSTAWDAVLPNKVYEILFSTSASDPHEEFIVLASEWGDTQGAFLRKSINLNGEDFIECAADGTPLAKQETA